MSRVCISDDPECGAYRHDSAAEYVYPDTGKTLAQEFPDQFFFVPWWAAMLLDFTGWLHGNAQRLVYRWKPDL